MVGRVCLYLRLDFDRRQDRKRKKCKLKEFRKRFIIPNIVNLQLHNCAVSIYANRKMLFLKKTAKI